MTCVKALHNGAWLVLDFDTVDCDLASYFDKDNVGKLNPLHLVMALGCLR